MMRSFVFAACLAAAALVSQDAFAQRVRAQVSPGIPAPVVGPGIAGTIGSFNGNSLGLSFGYGYQRPYRSFYYSPGYSYYGGYGYGYGYGSPYGIYYNPSANYLDYYLPPVYAPAELAYGPQAMQRFAGPPAVDPFGGIPGGLGAGAAAARPVEAKPADARPTVRVSNIEARRRAGRFVESGDELFRAQRYHEALQKYKSAAEAAPDLAEAYLRQGHALSATARYELAAAAFKRGLAIGPEWAESAFRLSSIYGGADLAKDTHVENLATALLEKPADADLIFVLAMFLHFDGDVERAARFFNRAGELVGKDAPHIRPFLPDGAPAKAPAEKAPRAAELPGIEA